MYADDIDSHIDSDYIMITRYYGNSSLVKPTIVITSKSIKRTLQQWTDV